MSVGSSTSGKFGTSASGVDGSTALSIGSVEDIERVISATASDSSEGFLAINGGGCKMATDGPTTISQGAGSGARSGCVAVFSHRNGGCVK